MRSISRIAPLLCVVKKYRIKFEKVGLGNSRRGPKMPYKIVMPQYKRLEKW